MADKYLKYDWLFTEMNRGEKFINGTLLKAYKDRKEWKGDREFVECLSNDREIMLAVANSLQLTPEQKEFFFGYMSTELNKDKDFLIKVMVATNAAEKKRANDTKKLEKINVNKKYLTKEVMESLVENKTDEFTIYSAGLDVDLFKDIITKDSTQLVRIAEENKKNPKFVKALIEVLVKSDEEVFKLPNVLNDNSAYCEALLTDNKYVVTLKENLREQAYRRINKVNDDFQVAVNKYRNESEENAGTCTEFFMILDKIIEDQKTLGEATQSRESNNNVLKLLKGQERTDKKASNEEEETRIKENQKLLDQRKEQLKSEKYTVLYNLYEETISKNNNITERYLGLIKDIQSAVNKTIQAKNVAKEKEEEAKKKEKDEKEKATKKAKEDKDRARRKGIVVAKYLDSKMKDNMTKLDEAVKDNGGR